METSYGIDAKDDPRNIASVGIQRERNQSAIGREIKPEHDQSRQNQRTVYERCIDTTGHNRCSLISRVLIDQLQFGPSAASAENLAYSAVTNFLSHMGEDMSHDLVIRGGVIVDGTGTEPFEGDIAIEGNTITIEVYVKNEDGDVIAPGVATAEIIA